HFLLYGLAAYAIWRVTERTGLVQRVGDFGAWGSVRPKAPGRVPGGTSPASPIPEGDRGPGAASPGDASAPVGDAGRAGGTPPGTAPAPLRRYPGPRTPFLVAGWVPWGSPADGIGFVTGIVAERGTYKSFVLLYLLLCLVTGRPFFGLPVPRLPTVLSVS